MNQHSSVIATVVCTRSEDGRARWAGGWASVGSLSLQCKRTKTHVFTDAVSNSNVPAVDRSAAQAGGGGGGGGAGGTNCSAPTAAVTEASAAEKPAAAPSSPVTDATRAATFSACGEQGLH